MKKFKGKKNAYGEIIKQYRIQKGFSRSTLSRELDLMGIPMSPDEIYRIENQKLSLKDYELIAICTILDIDYDNLKEIIK